MSGKKKLQKELKQPDKFQTQVFEFSDWASENKQKIKMVIYPLIAVAVLIFAFEAFKSQQTQTRRSGLAKIDMQYTSEDEAAQKKRTKIQEKITELTKKETEVKLADSKNKSAKKKEEKKADDKKAEDKKVAVAKVDLIKIAADKKALQDQLKDIKSDHAKSQEMYLKYFSKYVSYAEGWSAGLKASNIQIEMKQYKEAAENVNKILKNAGELDFYNVQVRMLYVSILEELSRFDDALVELEVLVKVAKEEQQPGLLLSKGRIQILKDMKTDAYATFEGLIAKHGSSREATKAKTIMALWN